MRVLVRSESEAFRLLIAAVVLGALSVLLGYLVTPLAGIILFVLVAAVASLADIRDMHNARSALRDAARVGSARERTAEAQRGGEERRRMLVIAGEAPLAETSPEAIVGASAPRPVLDVIAPVLQSKTHLVTTDIDRETDAARRRLRRTLAWAAEHGIEADGTVGDSIAPFARVEDELRRHRFDEVVVLTHPQSQASWFETQVLERVREELRSVPVRHVVIERGPSTPSQAPQPAR
ncbi:MAG: hypothetical protein JWN10_2444 [Solirubrobacterales bacterium]|nr:hypothetical protein [Solirubrobacterales bacterium]